MKISIFFCNFMTGLRSFVFVGFALLFLLKKPLKNIQFAKCSLFVSYVHDILVSFSYLLTPPFRSTKSLLFKTREATKLSKSKKKVSFDRIKFYWQTSVNFVGKYLQERLFPHKVFHFFFRRINIESFHAEAPSTEKMEVFWKKILK